MTDDELIEAARRDGWRVEQRSSRLEFTGLCWMVDYHPEIKRLEWWRWRVTIHWMVAEPADVFAKLQELKGMPV